jgi:hypothetical protein
MQIRSQRYVGGVAIALTVVLAACSSSTAPPKPLTSQQVAQDIDQAFASALAAGTAEDSSAASLIAEFVETGPAYGGTESSVTVTTGSGTQAWHAVGFVVDEGTGDSTFVTAMYPDRDLQTAMVVLMGTVDGTVAGGEALLSTTRLVSGGDTSITSGAATLVSKGSGTCSLQSGLAANAYLSTFIGSSTCTPAKYEVSFAVTFSTAANLGPLTTVSVSNLTINGPLFVASSGPSRVVGIPSKGAAMVLRLRALVNHRG